MEINNNSLYKEGFDLRLKDLDGVEPEFSILKDEYVKGDTHGPGHWAFAYLHAINSQNLAVREKVVQILCDNKDEKIVQALSLGGLHNKKIELSPPSGLNSRYYSIYLETAVLGEIITNLPNDEFPQVDILDEFHRNSLFSNLEKIFKSINEGAFAKATNKFRKSCKKSVMDCNLYDLNLSVVEFHKLNAGILPPDIFNFILLISSCQSHVNSAQILMGSYISHKFGSYNDIVEPLLCLRAAGACANSRKFLQSKFPRRFHNSTNFSEAPFGGKLAKFVKAARIQKYPASVPNLPKDHANIHKVVRHLLFIRQYCGDFNTEMMVSQLVKLISEHQSVIEHIDWLTVRTVLKHQRPKPSFESVYLSLVIMSPPVSTIYPEVEVTFGKGSLMSRLYRTLSSTGNTTIEGLTAVLVKVDQNILQDLVKVIVNKDIIDRFAHRFDQRTQTERNLPSVDIRSAALRLELIKSLFQEGLLNQEARDAFNAEAMDELKISFHKKSSLEGLVYIEWKKIKERLLKEQYDLLCIIPKFQTLKVDPNKNFSIRRILRELAGVAVEKVFLLGSVNVDQVLSSTLRHGGIERRTMRAFDDAAHRFIEGPGKKNWIDVIYQLSNESVDHFLRFYKFVETETDNFISNYLIPGQEEKFLRKTVREVYKSLRPLLDSESPAVNAEDVASLIISHSEKQLHKHLEEASMFLNKELREKFANGLYDLRRELVSDGDETILIEGIERSLDLALTECSGWVRISKRSEEKINFHLAEVIKLEIIEKHTLNFNEFNISTECYLQDNINSVLKKGDEYEIKGKYFDKIKNIISILINNAITHSGNGNRTKIDVEFSCWPSGFRLTMTNSINSRILETVKSAMPGICLQAQIFDRNSVQFDQGSGFHKIQYVCREYLGVVPKIEIRGLTNRIHSFTVDIVVEGLQEEIRHV